MHSTLLLLPTLCFCFQHSVAASSSLEVPIGLFWSFVSFIQNLHQLCKDTAIFSPLWFLCVLLFPWRGLFSSQPFSKGQITREYLYLKHFPQKTTGIQSDKSSKTSPESEHHIGPASRMSVPCPVLLFISSVSLLDLTVRAESPGVCGISPSSPAPCWTHPTWMSTNYQSIRNSSSNTKS